MTAREHRIAAATVLFAAALIFCGGVVMWLDAPSPADAAVGKGLVVIGGAIGCSTLAALILVWLDVEGDPARGAGRGARHTSSTEVGRSDWDDV